MNALKSRRTAWLMVVLLLTSLLFQGIGTAAFASRVGVTPIVGNDPGVQDTYSWVKMHPQGSTEFSDDLDGVDLSEFGLSYNEDPAGVVEWSSDISISFVFVKGGNGGNLYEYTGDYSDSDLHTLMNPKHEGQYQGLSHIVFYFMIPEPTTTTITSTTITTTTTTGNEEETTTTVTTTGNEEETTTTVTTTGNEEETTTTATTTGNEEETTTTVTTTGNEEETTTTVTTTGDEEVTTTTTGNEETTTRDRTRRNRTTTQASTTDITEETIPEGTPTTTVAEQQTEMIQFEELIPQGVPALPKTGELPISLFYGLGGVVTAVGLYLKRR